MPTLPWTATTATAPTGTPLVMASRFRLRRFRDVLPFLVDAMRIRNQVRRADGALGVSLIAHPLRREFATLSAWRDREAVNAMVRTEPHRSVMGRYRAVMAESTFEFYQVEELPPSWEDAIRRIG